MYVLAHLLAYFQTYLRRRPSCSPFPRSCCCCCCTPIPDTQSMETLQQSTYTFTCSISMATQRYSPLPAEFALKSMVGSSSCSLLVAFGHKRTDETLQDKVRPELELLEQQQQQQHLRVKLTTKVSDREK